MPPRTRWFPVPRAERRRRRRPGPSPHRLGAGHGPPAGAGRCRRVAGAGGQAVPLLALLVLLAGLVAVALADLGVAAVARARARTAADAAALAGAAEGEAAAAAAAEANGAELVVFEQVGTAAEVTVRLDGATARARAAAEGGGLAGGGDVNGLTPAMAAAVARAGQLLGRPVPVVSGYRSTAEQAALWANRAANPYPVARPGTSMHERGVAIDVPSSFVPVLLGVAGAAGLCQPLPASDPVHFELCGARGP